MHGMIQSGLGYSGLLTELASHGYLIFAIDSLDGTCEYT